MALDLKSFVLGLAVAIILPALGPLGWYGALALLLVGLLAWMSGGVRQSRSVPTPTNCRNCGAPNPPDRDECQHCGESLDEPNGQ